MVPKGKSQYSPKIVWFLAPPVDAANLMSAVQVSVVLLRCYVRKTSRTLNFDNPVYRKTTEDQVSLEKNQYQPPRSLPSVSLASCLLL